MDSSETPMKEDTLSSAPDSYTYENSFSWNCFLDEFDPETLTYTPPLATPFEGFNDVVDGKSDIQDSYDSKKASEEPLPYLSKEPMTVNQEKSSFLDEVRKILEVESPVQESREKVALNEGRNHQDRAAQLMPEPLQDIEECESFEEWLALDAGKKQSFDRHFLQFKEALSNFHESDEIGSQSEILIEDPYQVSQWSEGPLLLSEEIKTILQEKPAYVDELGKIQDVEYSKECRGVESNLSADANLEIQHFHGSIGQPEVNQLQNHPDCNPQLRPEPMKLQPEVNEWRNLQDCKPQLRPEAMQLQLERNECWQNLQNCNPQLRLEPVQPQPKVNEWHNLHKCNPQLRQEPVQLQPEVNEWQNPHNCNPQLTPEPMQLQPEQNEWKNHQDCNPQFMPEPMQLQPEENEQQKDCNPQLMPEPMQQQPEVNKWKNNHGSNPQLMPEPVQPQPEVNEWSQPMHNVTPALGLSAKIVEACRKHSAVRRCLRFEEFATNLTKTVGTPLHPASKDLTASPLPAMNSTSRETKMNKLPEYPQPIIRRALHDNKRLKLTCAGNAEEFNQPAMLEKQMNITPNTTDDKRRGCSCKKSKCIKRFCGCFAADSYCGEFCACQGCSNRPDKPDDTKQITEFCKPIASAPKNILQNAADNIPLNNMAQDPADNVNPSGKKDLLSADLHHNNVRRFSLNNVHGLSPPTPMLRYSYMNQLPAVNAVPITTTMTNSASMFGASWDRRHIRPHGNSLPMLATPMTRLGKITNQQSLEYSSNPVSFASSMIQNTTDHTPSYRTEDANMKSPSQPKWHKQCCACVSQCNEFSCDCYKSKAGCTSKCRCFGCENSYGNRKDSIVRKCVMISHMVEKPDANFHEVDMSQSSPSLNNLSQSQVTPVRNVIGANGQYLVLHRNIGHTTHGSIIHRWPK